jgi:hypothetical protein
MISKILSLTLIYLVAILVAQTPICGDSLDHCLRVVTTDPCVVANVDCTAAVPPQCKVSDGTCDITTGCRFTALPNYPPTLCNDGNPCTVGDACIDGNCFPGVDVICDNTVCNTGAYCDTTTGNCAYTGMMDCTPTTTCQTGVCSETAGGCVYTNIPNGSPCNNNLPCTIDTCTNGQCLSAPVVCANQPCKIGTCNPLSGQCEYTDVICQDMPCMTGSCSTATNGCVYTSVTNGSPCATDNNACTTDTCLNGQCAHTPFTCTAPCMTNGVCDRITGQCSFTPMLCPARPCMSGVCNPATGQCTYTPITCNDNNPCTTDTCSATTGRCVYTPMTCTRTGSNPCQYNNGTCNPTTGQCVYGIKPNGTTCDDANVCTTKDKCVSGQCTGTNTCCMNRTKNKCGICVSDCCEEYGKVLSFFGMRGGEYDVTEVSGGGCSGSTVCCAPISQSLFTYQSDKCVVRKA